MNIALVDVLFLLLKYLRRDDGCVKSVLTRVYNAIMQVEAEMQAGCKSYERCSGRRLHRNGYKQRGLTTLYGNLVLNKPQFREEGFKTVVFGACSRVEKGAKPCGRIVPARSEYQEDRGRSQRTGYRGLFGGWTGTMFVQRWFPLCNIAYFGAGIYIVRMGLYPRIEHENRVIGYLADISFYVYLTHRRSSGLTTTWECML